MLLTPPFIIEDEQIIELVYKVEIAVNAAVGNGQTFPASDFLICI